MNWYKNWYSRGNAKAPGHPWGLILCLKSGGAEGIRTLDPLLAKQMPCTGGYIVLPSIIPITAAISPSRTLPPRLTAAMDKSPLSNNWIVATLRVENVV